jgi:hypothetical protein
MLFFPRFGRDRDSGAVYGSAEMQAAVDWALDLAGQIEERLVGLAVGENPERLFPPAPGAACRWCGFALDCQAAAEDARPGLGELKTAEEARAAAAEVMRLEAAAAALRARLKEWVAAKGPQWALVPSVRWHFAPEALARVAEEIAARGLNPWEVFTLGATEVDRLKKAGWGEAELEALGGRRTVYQTLRALKLGQAAEEKPARSRSAG